VRGRTGTAKLFKQRLLRIDDTSSFIDALREKT
jgi:hypothetical protein